MKSAAYLSEDRRYRYWLMREWDETLPKMCVIGLNPSTADENTDDPTIRKCIGFARRLNCGGILMLNVGAYRATDPRKWRKAGDPFGPENTDDHMRHWIAHFGATLTVAAWGKNGNHAKERCCLIKYGIPDLWCFGKNTDGTPRHPLMLPYSTRLQSFTDRNAVRHGAFVSPALSVLRNV